MHAQSGILDYPKWTCTRESGVYWITQKQLRHAWAQDWDLLGGVVCIAAWLQNLVIVGNQAFLTKNLDNDIYVCHHSCIYPLLDIKIWHALQSSLGNYVCKTALLANRHINCIMHRAEFVYLGTQALATLSNWYKEVSHNRSGHFTMAYKDP